MNPKGTDDVCFVYMGKRRPIEQMMHRARSQGGIHVYLNLPQALKHVYRTKEAHRHKSYCIASHPTRHCLRAGKGSQSFLATSFPQRHVPAGGGQEYNEVPPINQVTGHGSEGDRNPFSFYWGHSCFIENGCDALGELQYNLSRWECHLFASAVVIQ